MTISKRILTKWRKEALQIKNGVIKEDWVIYSKMKMVDRILKLTQELIDQELIKETKDASN